MERGKYGIKRPGWLGVTAIVGSDRLVKWGPCPGVGPKAINISLKALKSSLVAHGGAVEVALMGELRVRVFCSGVDCRKY